MDTRTPDDIAAEVSRDQEVQSHLHGDPDGLGAARGIINGLVIVACFVLACWLAWCGLQIARSALAHAAITTMDYLHTGPGCPGADPAWLGWCSDAPKGGQ